jgi:hypothetical protein
MTTKTRAELQTDIDVIRNESRIGGNTNSRIAKMFEDSADSPHPVNFKLPNGTDSVSSNVNTPIDAFAPHINVMSPTFGMRNTGDPADHTWNTDAWADIVVSAQSARAAIFLPPGIYCFNPHIVDGYSGLRIRGAGTKGRPQGGDPIGQGTIIRAAASAPYLMSLQATDFHFEDIWFDGAGLVDDVLYFNYFTTQGHFERCRFSGAKPASGFLHRFTGNLQVDNISFHRCLLEQKITGLAECAALVRVENTQCYGINYQNCLLQGGNIGCLFTEGSANFDGCQFFDWSTNFFQVNAVCNAFTVSKFYTEGTNNPFYQQYVTSGVQSPQIHAFRDGQIQANAAIVWNRIQPLIFDGVSSGGVLYANETITYGVHKCTKINSTFQAYSGAAIDTAVFPFPPEDLTP